MNVSVRNAQRRVPVSAAEVRRLAAALADLAGVRSGELGVALVSDRRMQALNQRFRGLDRPTDVLSFDLADRDLPAAGEVAGEIVISADTVARRAGGGPDRFRRELELLVAHGILHLLGRDHDDPGERQEFQRAQRSLLARYRRRTNAMKGR